MELELFQHHFQQELFRGVKRKPNAELAALTLNHHRMKAYQESFVLRITDSLKEAFPKLCAVLGDETFFHLTREFLEAKKPRSFDLYHLNFSFERFCRSHFESLPCFVELVGFELLLNRCFHSFEAPALPFAVFQERFGASPEDFRVAFQPHVFLARFETKAFRLWDYVNSGRPVGDFRYEDEKATHVSVHRSEWKVYVAEVSSLYYEFFQALMKGQRLGDICESFEERLLESEFPPLHDWLKEGVDQGLFADSM